MQQLYLKFLLLLSTTTNREKARPIQLLPVKAKIVRSMLHQQITLSERERQRLIRFGKPLGAATNLLITIVSLRIFAPALRCAVQAEQNVPPSAWSVA